MAAVSDDLKASSLVQGRAKENSLVTTEEGTSNVQMIKTCARRFLGYSCDRTRELTESGIPLIAKVIDVKEDYIDVDKVETFYAKNIGTSEEYVLAQLDKQFQVRLDLKISPQFSLQGALGFEKSPSTAHEDEKLVYVVRHLSNAVCKLNRRPALRSDVRREEMGDAIAASGIIYTGYDLIFTIKFHSEKVTDKKKVAGNLKLGIFDEWLKLEGSGSREINRFKDKQIKDVIVNVRVIGDFSFVTRESSCCKVEDITTIETEIKEKFLRHLSTSPNRAYYIRIQDVFEACFSPSTPASGALKSPFSPFALDDFPSMLTDNVPDTFENLAERIKLFYEEALSVALKIDEEQDLSLSKILEDLEKFFGNVLKIASERRDTYTEILGESGVGKSLLTGYLLGRDVQKTNYVFPQTQRQATVLDFFNRSPDSSGECPIVGHGKSETKGIAVYGKYIDTGGYLDLSGSEANICNSVAIDMITRKLKPNRVIFVMSPSVFENRGQRFLEHLERLRKYIPRLCTSSQNDRSVLSSIMFLFNDKTIYLDSANDSIIREREGKIIESIDLVIARLEEEQDALFSSKNAAWRALKIAYRTAKHPLHAVQATSEPQIPLEVKQWQERKPEKYKKWVDFEEKIALLELIKENRSNIIYVDFGSSTTRFTVNKWQAEAATGNLSPDNFIVKDLHGETKMRVILNAVASYFNTLFKKSNDFNQSIHELNNALMAISGEIQSLQEGLRQIEQDPNQLITTYQQEKANCEEKLKRAEEKLQNFIDQKIAIKREIETLKESQKQVYWKDVKPTEPITPRSFLAFGALAKTYSFKYDELPIHHLDLIVPTKSQKRSGEYFNEDRAQLSEGKYTVSYRPAWWGYTEDCTATVKIYVKEKDHPATVGRITELKTTLEDPDTGLEVRISILDSQIEGYKSRIRGLDLNIQGQNDLAIRKVGAEKVIQEHQTMAEELKRRLRDEKKKEEKNRLEIETFKNLCYTVKDMIQQMYLVRQTRDQENPDKKTFELFIRNVQCYQYQ